jgi:ATPase subunit of ABC transporter with duplicated ATPase domains
MNEILFGGSIIIDNKQTIGYLQQTAVSGSNQTIFDEACSAMKDVQLARQRLHQAEQKVAQHSDNIDSESFQNDLTALDDAISNYEQLGGYEQEKEVAEMLNGLGFTNLTQPCSELSGGWQMRVSFAKVLLSKPSLCLMDEPSNHLDRSARAFLARYLKDYNNGAMILVTHDKELLDSCQHIAEITSTGTLQIYKSCTYSQYLKLKEERAKAATTEYERNKEKADKLQSFVDRFGASATKASAAQSRVKQLEKMKAQGLLDAPSQDLIEKRFKPYLKLPHPPRPNGESILSIQNDAMIGYDDPDTGITVPLISNVNLDIQRGMKILIRGPNGAGKTTLLHSLRGTLPLIQGKRIENPLLRLGVFTQDLAQELDTNKRAVDTVLEYARNGPDGDITITDQQARQVLGGLGLTGEKALRKVGQLSGGEKARVALAMFALKPSNLYLLDEVSNHLDIECVEALSESLSNWGDDIGSLVVISHDRAFCDQVGFTHILTIQDNGTLLMEQRNTNDKDWDSSTTTTQRLLTDQQDDDGNFGSTNTASPSEKEMDPKIRKMAYNAPKRISKIENLVEELEEKIATINEIMLATGNDVGELVELSKEKESLETKVAALMEEWEELESLLATVS